ncbi:hypothetical protein WOLCODRAFT_162542 [Wolfiporia cocos MD-104 SS10]|uniref:Zn(2)-C6 fungal-type domain-containing protein n=1 Tax=Wolfiporia cocos (strain MD-104) TaxID=742152 RepID=A0A2H3JLQ0_WOLCO|nr:hypothetical protein WOLCODRAFT_162542 [Wolfiporia cocos MD-104 SS10]
MSLHALYSEPSDEEIISTPSDKHINEDQGSRRRSTRACDQCRRTKSKCERDKSGPAKRPCRACVALGLSCTYAGPSHKRGPPKGYILAIERRLHQVEALLGTIIGSDDPRARGLLQDLSQDQLAKQIIHRVDTGPFGPKGRVAHPFGSTKEDFLAMIMNCVGDDVLDSVQGTQGTSPRSDNFALVSPSSSWQDNLQRRLLPRASGAAFPLISTDTGQPGNFSPDPRTRRASFPLMSSNVVFPPKVPPILSMESLSSLSELDTGNGRVSWDNIEGLERMESDSGDSEDVEVRSPPRSEDVYIDQDAQVSNISQSVVCHIDTYGFQIHVANRISGLQLLRQCQKILTGRSDDSLECPWPSTVSPAGTCLSNPSALSQAISGQQHDHLMQTYFAYVHPMFPVVNRVYLGYFYNQKLNHAVQGSLPPSTLSTVSLDVLLLSINALASQYLGQRMGGISSKDYASEALRLLYSLHGRSHPLLCQALLLLGYFSVGIGSMEDGWSYIGLAIRMAQSLGVHRAVDDLALPTSGVLSKDEQQMRQQLWSGCLVADRFIAVLLGRPSAILLTRFDALPVDLSDIDIGGSILYSIQNYPGFQTEQVNETTVTMCFNASRALFCIIGSIMESLYPITHTAESILEGRTLNLDHRLSQWRCSLPAALQLDLTGISVLPPPCVLELHIQYWWAVILLHRALINGPLSKGFYAGPDGAQAKALAVCRDASRQMASIVNIVYNQPNKPYSAFSSGFILSSGIIDVLTLSVLGNDEQTSAQLRHTMSALQRIETIWPMARVVQDLMGKAMIASPSTPIATPSSPSMLKNKRSASQVFSDDDSGVKKMPTERSPSLTTPHYFKDRPAHNYDNFGRLLGIGTGLGFITSEPYPGFHDRRPQAASSSAGQDFSESDYNTTSRGSAIAPSSSFGLW